MQAQGVGDPGSVTCNTHTTPEPAAYAPYGHLTMFDCCYRTSTGTEAETCMMSGGQLGKAGGQWATDGEGTCAAAGKVLSLLPGGVSLPATTP